MYGRQKGNLGSERGNKKMRFSDLLIVSLSLWTLSRRVALSIDSSPRRATAVSSSCILSRYFSCSLRKAYINQQCSMRLFPRPTNLKTESHQQLRSMICWTLKVTEHVSLRGPQRVRRKRKTHFSDAYRTWKIDCCWGAQWQQDVFYE